MKTTETLASEIKTIKRQIKVIADVAAEIGGIAFEQETQEESARLYDASGLLDETMRKLQDELGHLTAELSYQNALDMAKNEMAAGVKRLTAIAQAAETYGLMDGLVWRMMNEIEYK